MDISTDEQIAVKVQNGNIQDFGVLVERYEAKMLRYAKKFLFGYHESEDVVQDVFLKAYSYIQSFDPARKFSSWLYRIAHNEFINAIKKKSREPLTFFDYDTFLPHPASSENIEKDLDRKETREILNKCLDQLSPKYREPLVLYYFEELDYSEISEIMHIPVSTVGVRLARGRVILKDIYTKSFKH
jgi:RNA polymerase sigma-70 factor (ECF subfamily)